MNIVVIAVVAPKFEKQGLTADLRRMSAYQDEKKPLQQPKVCVDREFTGEAPAVQGL